MKTNSLYMDKLLFELTQLDSNAIKDNKKFKEITICLDMHGCPNRCRHCWLGATPNGNMPFSELESTAEQFGPFTDCLQIYDWYREPDFTEKYREQFELCNRLSDRPLDHFEVASFWRLARDGGYGKWLASLGLKKIQLTLFGDARTTDFYIGRKGAYRELLKAMDVLMENKISPRIQVFVSRNNIDQLGHIENLIKELDLENRCAAFGGEFTFFLHQGSCDGENEKWYDAWITPEDLGKIPPLLEEYTLRHFEAENLGEVFGRTEQSLCEELITDASTASYVSDTPVFYIDKDFDVYPNISTPAPHWRLGSLKQDGARTVLENYVENKSAAQHIRMTVPLRELAKDQGDSTSRRLFSRGDYIEFLLNRYCRQREKDESSLKGS